MSAPLFPTPGSSTGGVQRRVVTGSCCYPGSFPINAATARTSGKRRTCAGWPHSQEQGYIGEISSVSKHPYLKRQFYFFAVFFQVRYINVVNTVRQIFADLLICRIMVPHVVKIICCGVVCHSSPISIPLFRCHFLASRKYRNPARCCSRVRQDCRTRLALTWIAADWR